MRIGDMKKTLKNVWRVLMAMAVMAMVAGCADGELATPVSPSITPPAPMIIKFAADPSSIRSGESTTISWEVAGADEVEITAVSSTGEAVAFDVKTEDLSGEAPVTLTSTTDFVLTATKTADSPESDEESDEAALSKSGQIQFGPEPVEEEPLPSTVPAVSSVSQTITVTVSDAQDLTADIEPDQPSVDACEQTVIRWTVNPSENVSVTVTADTGEAISPTDQCNGSIADILGQPVSDPVPAVGCAVVAPCETTNYTVNATDSHGNSATDSAVVSVDTDVNAKIMAAKDEGSTPEDYLLEVDSYQKPVIVSWEATPEAAKVTVTATPSATCTPELPVDAEGQTTGSASCEITGETIFHIVATVGSESDEDEVRVGAFGASAGLIVADQWAFEDERISLEMKLTATSNPEAVAKVLVNGSPISDSLVQTLKSGSIVKVPDVVAKMPYVTVNLLNGSDETLDTVNTVQVINLVVDGLGEDEVGVTSIDFDDSGVRYYGVQLKDYNKGVARMYVQKMSTAEDITPSAKEFNYMEPIQDLYNMDELLKDAFFKKVDTYPVRVAVREESENDVFAATTGALMWSQDGGENFREILIMRVRAGPDLVAPGLPGAKEGDHLTCGRADYGDMGGPKIQTGTKPRFPGDIISLNQMCDVYVSKGGRIIVATDFGVWTEADIDDHADNDNFSWKGTPPSGTTQDQIESDGYLTYGKVVNELAVVEDDSGNVSKVFAGTAYEFTDMVYGDVYVSEDKGATWKKFGSLDEPVYALDYDARNRKLYAGTETGLWVRSIDGDEGWSQKGLSDPVISVAVDPASPIAKMTIIAGTPAGAKISRDGGESFSALELPGGTQEVQSVAISARKSGDTVRYGISLGSNKGQLFQMPVVGAQTTGDFAAVSLMPIED